MRKKRKGVSGFKKGTDSLGRTAWRKTLPDNLQNESIATIIKSAKNVHEAKAWELEERVLSIKGKYQCGNCGGVNVNNKNFVYVESIGGDNPPLTGVCQYCGSMNAFIDGDTVILYEK